MLYRQKYGPFNPTLRIDAAIARGITIMRGGSMKDYMPWPKDDGGDFDPMVIAAKLSAVAMKNNAREKARG